MEIKLRISLVDEMNNIIEEISHIRPYNFDELIIIIKKKTLKICQKILIYIIKKTTKK